MSNLLRRASDALHLHQRKDSEDSVNQDSVVNPSQEPQEPQNPQLPQVSQEPQGDKAEPASQPEAEGDNKDKAAFVSDVANAPHHHHWGGFLRRSSEEEREKRRVSQQDK
ncbi:uncharacterized protein N7458_012180 [Penicillium daleae]|uniref:Uncharacterized protein n=1 Tax=Penicillium daleae TaxID=63821 RepID=A0AAD6BUD9_9EURO|nr:uncharacterized protein N7458_012180 [Penicillium daleae]KAJ5433024.1 hypothetical protein N7458_012180 [Penicillium daleae]